MSTICCIFARRSSNSYDLGLATYQIGIRGSDGGQSRVREESRIDQRASVVDEILADQWRTQKDGCCAVSKDRFRYLISCSSVPPLQANALPKVCSRTDVWSSKPNSQTRPRP